ncbi:MAG: leucine-rich repeat domain-containing protein [Paludibacteraceae bacterium]|nr:leucine-rich repeat domain-containing protein [Paludibacteraceae bacterium]
MKHTIVRWCQALLFLGCLVFPFFNVMSQDDPVRFKKGDFRYEITDSEEHTVAIRANTDVELYGDIILPSEVEYEGEKYTVTSIGGVGFSGCKKITSVRIPNTVTSIKTNAFEGCYALTSINIPEGDTLIEWNAFRNCESLKSITLPESLTLIYSEVFKGCASLEQASLPNTLEGIDQNAFEGCANLSRIDLPNSLTYIREEAFAGCEKLYYLQIPNSVSWFGNDDPFGKFEDYGNVGTLVYNGPVEGGPWGAKRIIRGDVVDGDFVYSDETKKTLIGYIGTSSELVIPDHVEAIKDSSFMGYNELTSVIIPSSITSIGSCTFKDCNQLTSISIPNTITNIGENAFSGCDNLTSITLPSSVESIGKKAFSGCIGLTSIQIPNSVEVLEDSLFFNCTSLTSVIVPNSVTSLGEGVFLNDKGLTTLYIPSSVGTIGDNAFSGVNVLIYEGEGAEDTRTWGAVKRYHEEVIEGDFIYEDETKKKLVLYIGTESDVTIPETVITIGARAFEKNSSIQSVTMPDSVRKIETAAFANCEKLTKVVLSDSLITIGDGAFYHCKNITELEIPQSVDTIGMYAFQISECKKKVWEVPNTVVSIGEGAFNGVEVVLYNGDLDHCPWRAYFKGKSQIGDFIYADEGNKQIARYIGEDANVIIPDSVTRINQLAFMGKKMVSIDIPSSVTYIAMGSFYSCTNLKSVVIPESVTSLGDEMGGVVYGDVEAKMALGDRGVFDNCANLTSVTIPNSITKIPQNAFHGCKKLTSIVIPSSVTEIDEYAFTATGLTSFEMPNSVTSIGVHALAYNDSLTSVTLSESLTTISSCTFRDCGKLTSVTIPTGVKTIGEEAFAYCPSLSSITLPNSIEHIMPYAFLECTSLKSIVIPNSVSSIGDFAFEACESLTSVTIPSSVTSMGCGVFYRCENLTTIRNGRPMNVRSAPAQAGAIYCQVEKKPDGWDAGWTSSQSKIVWGAPMVTIEAEPDDEKFGSVIYAGTYLENGEALLIAHPKTGYKFIKWEDGNTDSVRTVNASEAKKYKAQFSPILSDIPTVKSDSDDRLIYGTKEAIVVEKATEDVYVFNTAGVLIIRQPATEEHTEIAVQKGIYVIKTGMRSKLIIVN